MLFAITLWVFNYHHSTAFVAIREFLCSVESIGDNKVTPHGPWQAQKGCREDNAKVTFMAWRFPYAVLALIGIMSIVIGAKWTP